ncbi:MAG TPA: MFS transporter [Gemmatimonadota bacterium]|nr:MFS transporter [Gemmatimonadota bacterium]
MIVPAADGKTPFWSAFRNPGYRTFWIGAFVSNIGAWMQNVAQGWLVLELTDSAFMLGLVGFAGSLPWLVLLLVGGVYADRLDRRRLLIRANLAMMACAAVLTALTWTGAVRIWHVFALSLASGSAIALAAPAFQAFLHDLVGRRDLQNAIALNSAQFNLSRVVGPSLAGLTLGAIGLAGCFGVNTISYLGAIVALMLIQVASRPVPPAVPVWDSIVEGFGYVRDRPESRRSWRSPRSSACSRCPTPRCCRSSSATACVSTHRASGGCSRSAAAARSAARSRSRSGTCCRRAASGFWAARSRPGSPP